MLRNRNPDHLTNPVRFKLAFGPVSPDESVPGLTALTIVRGLHHHLPMTPSPVGDLAPVAIRGLGALALMSSDAEAIPRDLPVLCAFGTPDDALRILRQRHHHTQLDDAAAQAVIASSEFLRLHPDTLIRPVPATPPADGTEFRAVERGARMLSLAALRSASVSTVKVRWGSSTEYLQIPHLTPAGVLLDVLSRMGRAAGLSAAFATRIEQARPTASPEQLAHALAFAARYEAELDQVRIEFRRAAPRIVAAYRDVRNEAYRSVTDAIFDDPDVTRVMNDALTVGAVGSRPTLRAAHREALFHVLTDLKREVATIAAGGHPKALRSRRATPQQSPRGH
jgi:hypothetical protein